MTDETSPALLPGEQPAVTTRDPFTMAVLLCDRDGFVGRGPRPGGSTWPTGNQPTFLEHFNYLRSLTGLKPTPEPFVCTGAAHVAGEHIRCTSPAHNRPAEPMAGRDFDIDGFTWPAGNNGADHA